MVRRLFGLKDYQIASQRLVRKRFALRALAVVVRVLLNGIAAVPAVLLGLPFVLSYQVGRAWAQRERRKQLQQSSVKISGRDVVATYKVALVRHDLMADDRWLMAETDDD